MFRCCWDLVKFILFIVNFAAFVVIGLALAASVYALVDSKAVLGFNVEPILSKENPTALYFILLLTCSVVFGFLLLFTFLGCCGAACQNRCMLGSFAIILLVFLTANVAGIVYMYVSYPNGEVEMLASELDKSIAYYRADDPESLSRRLWDFMQPQLRCCGANSLFDWTSGQLKAGRKVPASCCDPRVDQASECVYSPSVDNGGFMRGCVSVMAFTWRLLFWSLPSAMALVLVLALMVCSRQKEHSLDDVRDRRRGKQTDYYNATEDPGYVYRPSSYPSAPPYNDGYGGGHRGTVDQYPTGVIPPQEYHQPLMQQPPSYHDVVHRRH